MQRTDAAAQVAEQLALGPRRRRGIGIRQSRRDPIVDHGAGIGILGLFGAEQVARRVTATAMAEPFGQVGAAIPLGASGRVRLIAAAPEEQELPAFLEDADVEREGNRARRHHFPGRWPCHHIGIERRHVVVRNLGEMIVWEDGKKVRSIAGDALMHRAGEGLQRPPADAGFRIGRDVGRIDRAKGRALSVPTGEGLSALPCVAYRAISGCGEDLALGDRLGGKAGLGRGIDGGDGRPPREGEEPEQGNNADPGDADRNALQHSPPPVASHAFSRQNPTTRPQALR